MRMYGGRKQIKSVERKVHPIVTAAGYTANYQMYQPQYVSSSNSKLSTSY